MVRWWMVGSMLGRNQAAIASEPVDETVCFITISRSGRVRAYDLGRHDELVDRIASDELWRRIGNAVRLLGGGRYGARG